MKNVLTIGGSDSSGGSEIQADIKTISAHGTYAMSVITAIIAQNTQGIMSVQNVDPGIIKDQIDAIFKDIKVDAVKIGMVNLSENIRIIAERMRYYKPSVIVLDPVMTSKTGYILLQNEALKTLEKELLPIATIITPNLQEAEILTRTHINTYSDLENACRKIYSMGPKYVLIKGGNLEVEPVDTLFDGKLFRRFESMRINTKNTHGAGATLSAAIAANLAVSSDVPQAISLSKKFITGAIEQSITLGSGNGPVHHFYRIFRK